MRRLINILAVIIGTASGLAGLGGAGIVCAAVYALFKPGTVTPPDLPGWAALGIGTGITFLGMLIASRALLHLRHPDAGTVRDMIGTAIYLIVLGGVVPLGLKFHVPGALLLAAVIVLYLFHRYFVRQVITRAFPPDGTSPQT